MKEVTLSINKSGLGSPGTASRYYDMVRFLGLPPTAELAWPAWIKQACWEERAETLDHAGFWPPEITTVHL